MNSAQITSYWSEANRLIEIAAKYSQKVALKANLLDNSTAWEVKEILRDYYGGSTDSLERSISFAKRTFEMEVKNFNTRCRIYDITEIKCPDKLLMLLTDPVRRNFYKKAIKKAIKAQTAYRLQDIELSFTEKPST